MKFNLSGTYNLETFEKMTILHKRKKWIFIMGEGIYRKIRSYRKVGEVD